MIVPGQRTPIVMATRPVDFRRGHDGLAATVQKELGLDPHSGLTVVFRSRRGDRVKIRKPPARTADSGGDCGVSFTVHCAYGYVQGL